MRRVGPQGLGPLIVDPTVMTWSQPTRQHLPARFWGLAVGDGLSAIGDGVVRIAAPLLAVRLSGGSPLAVTGVVIAQQVPWLVFGLVGGALADRLDRRTLAVSAEIVRACAHAVLAWSLLGGNATLALLAAVAFVDGSSETVVGAVGQSALPDIVTADDLPAANGYLGSARWGGVAFVGPAVGGLLYTLSPSMPFAVDAASFVVSAVLLGTMIPARPTHEAVPGPDRITDDRITDDRITDDRMTDDRMTFSSLRADIVEGGRYFLGDPLLRSLALAIGPLAACQAAASSVTVLFARDALGLGPGGYGTLVSVGAVGGILAGFVVAPLRRRLGAGRLLAVAALGAGSAYIAFGLTRTVAVAAVALCVESIGIGIGNAQSLALRQAVVPAHLRGRVGNAFRSWIFGVRPLGPLLAGAVAGWLGVGWTIVAVGVVQLVSFVAVAPALLSRIAEHEARAGAGTGAGIEAGTEGGPPGVLDRSVKDS